MAEVKWIKLNVDMFDDEKIKLIQAMPEGDSLSYIWIRLILLAGKTNDGGYIYMCESMPYTEEMLSIIFNKPLPIIRLAIDTFTSLGMIESDEKGIFLINFEKHQSLDKLEQIREQNRLRQRKFKEKKRLESKVTLPVTQSNAIDIDKDKEEDIDNKKENIKRKRFIKPTIEEIAEYCKERNNGINANAFYDFYESKDWMIGKNKMKDFKAAVRNWEQREKKELKEKGDFKRPSWLDMDL